jgi:hypothetical protein
LQTCLLQVCTILKPTHWYFGVLRGHKNTLTIIIIQLTIFQNIGVHWNLMSLKEMLNVDSIKYMYSRLCWRDNFQKTLSLVHNWKMFINNFRSKLYNKNVTNFCELKLWFINSIPSSGAEFYKAPFRPKTFRQNFDLKFMTNLHKNQQIHYCF